MTRLFMGLLGRGSRSFFEETSVHVNELQNLFLMIDLDVWDRLGHI